MLWVIGVGCFKPVDLIVAMEVNAAELNNDSILFVKYDFGQARRFGCFDCFRTNTPFNVRLDISREQDCLIGICHIYSYLIIVMACTPRIV